MTLATLQAIRQVPPLYERAGRTLGAGGWALYRKIIFPAALPGVMAGLQQAWGFAWKALMAGELIVTAANATGLGHLLGRPGTDVPTLLAALAVILVIGVAVDYLLFGQLDRRIRRRGRGSTCFGPSTLPERMGDGRALRPVPARRRPRDDRLARGLQFSGQPSPRRPVQKTKSRRTHDGGRCGFQFW